MYRDRLAKIVATVGPASSSPETLKRLFLAGVDTFRLNFSHGSHDAHAAVHTAIRKLEAELKTPIGILQDLQGPKIRIGVVNDGPRIVGRGESIRFTLGAPEGSGEIQLPHQEIFDAVAPGHEFLIDDGRMRFEVVAVNGKYIEAKAVVAGQLSSRKGVNLPGTILDLSPLTAKDRTDLNFGLELGVDWVALSFVQKPTDLIEARGLIGANVGLLAKIEKPSALEHIEEIVELSDAIMVARGDLGVEIPHEEVPGRQKELVALCRRKGKPVVVATQMLDSMVSAPAPTRAEASDVATAIYDGADAVMLSAESASGTYPIQSVTMMDNIIRKTEGHKFYASLIKAADTVRATGTAQAVAACAAGLADNIGAAAIVAFTASGTTASRIARMRPHVPTLAVTPDEQTSRRMCLLWGVHSVLSDDVAGYDEMLEQAARHLKGVGLAKPGKPVVVVAGTPFGVTGTTNNIRVIKCD